MKKLLLTLTLIISIIIICKSAGIAKVGDDYILSYNLKSFSDDVLIHNDDGSVSLKDISNSENENYNEPVEKIKSLSMPISITNPFANLYEHFEYFVAKLQKKVG